MNLPKIFVDGHILDGKPQGTTTYLTGLYKAIAEENLAKVLIATYKKSSLDKYNLTHPNISWVKLSTQNKYIRLLFNLPYLELKNKPDYSHYNYITPILKFSKRIVTCHDLLFLDFPEYFPYRYRIKNKILFYISIKLSNIVSTVSKYSAKSISNHFLIPYEKIMIAPNAISKNEEALSIKSVANLTKSAFFVYVSRFEPRKNQHSLIRAFNKFCDNTNNDFKLVLVGYSALHYLDLEKAIAESKKDRIMILSNIKQEELMWLYKNAIASIYPSHAEGFGIPPIEAIAAGGRSYCANNTSLIELKDYIDGTFDQLSDDELIETFYQASSNINSNINKNLQKKVVEKFSWKNSAHKFMTYLC